MKSDQKVSTLSEVYSRIIERTVNALKNYLKLTKKKHFKYDIVQELKNRWKLRVDHTIGSMNGSWAKFQDSCIQKNVKYDSDGDKKTISYDFCFPSICSLSWDLYKNSDSKESIASNFKLWVWNCMISGSVNEGNLPIPAFLWHRKKVSLLKSITSSTLISHSRNSKKNIFNFVGLLKNRNHCENSKENTLSFLKYYSTCKNLTEDSFEKREKELFDENSEEELESNTYEKYEKNSAPNFLLAVIEKVYRRNTKWTIVLKNGILNINKKDFLFNLCKCEFFW
jgi:hypothetical protein